METLREIAIRCGTDKVQFGYTDIYEKYLEPRRKDILRVLEIGTYNGASLRMWRDYFQKAEVYGLDINPDTLFEDKRIRTLQFDQGASGAEYARMLNIIAEKNDFDIIIDDGSHFQQHIMQSFTYLFGALKPGGYYFIEDVANEQISLRQGHTWGSEKPDFSDAVIKIFEEKKKKKLERRIESIDIYYAQKPPLTQAGTSDVIVVKKAL